MAWETSTRRAQLPPDWEKRRQATKDRAGNRCESKTHDPRCDGWGNECDHRTPGNDHDLTNLQWLNHWCHQAKTIAERPSTPSRKRAAPQHPGVIP